MKVKYNPWMVSPKSFIKLLGAEYDIMQQAGATVLGKFYFAAICIVLIIFLSVVSIRYAIDLLFPDLLTEIVLSVFFALLFACIYIFLINTFSKDQDAKRNKLFSLSNIIRFSFIVFIAYLVVQPVTIAAMGDKLEQQTTAYKQAVLQKHLNTIGSFYASDLDKLQRRAAYCTQQKAAFGAHHFDAELDAIETAISSINDKENYMAAEARRKIEGGSFFLYRIQMSTHHIRSWLLTAFIVLLFVLPGYLIYNIAADDAYYALKKAYEKNIIVQGYTDFELQYKKMFLENYGVAIELFSRFEDPPFKHVRKIPEAPCTMDDFLKKYITAAD